MVLRYKWASIKVYTSLVGENINSKSTRAALCKLEFDALTPVMQLVWIETLYEMRLSQVLIWNVTC